MRMIGHVEGEARARRFGDFLLVQGIENQVEADKDSAWAVWVHADEDLERAKALLADYRQNPADPKFQQGARAADKLKEQKRQEQAAYEKKLKQRRHLFRNLSGYGFGPVTLLLIIISVVVYYLQTVVYHGDDKPMMKLFISDFTTAGDMIEWQRGLHEIRHGEIWRLFTPMFLHFSVMGIPVIHLLFNMLWLRDLGSMIEARQNSFLLLILVLVISAGSNFAQFYFFGPYFGGMSGVVYGLIGYIWIRGKFDPGSGLYLHPTTVSSALVWFVVCFTGAVGPIGNAAHGAGLAIGMAWGWLSSLRYR